MNANRKAYGPLDKAVLEVIHGLRGDLSGRAVSEKSGLGHNRTAVILRGATPPPTVGEIEALSLGFGKLASEVIEIAEQRLASANHGLPQRFVAASDELAALRAEREAEVDRRLEHREDYAASDAELENPKGEESP